MKLQACPGRERKSRNVLLGLCIRCARLGALGGLAPEARLEAGVAVCVNWVQLPTTWGALP